MKINTKKVIEHKLVLINYANNLFKESQLENTKSASSLSFFDEIISYNPKDIDKVFLSENKSILKEKRGNGYWLWKPYFIKKTLEKLKDGDFLFYCDSGSFFISDFIELIKTSISLEQDIIPFELIHLEKEWTKRDAFLLMGCDSPIYSETKQRLASFSLWRKSDLSMKFLNEWIRLSKDKRILTDIPNTLGKPNYINFKEHRHDQSIFSLLTKKYKLVAFRDPSQFGNSLKAEYLNSNYNQFIQLTRKRNKGKFFEIKKMIKRLKKGVFLLLILSKKMK